ncbi:MAG: hypothetical protein IM638_20250 [Bacteroidetes bacterium]|nr:hypothetical protein [Bacteroidota bacterium]
MFADDFLSDEELLKLRPEVVFDSSRALPAEKFQGETLRPILKYKNEWLLGQLRAYLTKRFPGFAGFTQVAQYEAIENAVKRNAKFRQTIMQAVFALMTKAEKEFAHTHRKDVAGRLTQLLIERFVSQREKLL